MRTRKVLLAVLGASVVLCGAYLVSRAGRDGMGVGLAGVLVALLGAAAMVGGIRLRRAPSRPVRPCPRCGRPVAVGTLECGGCGFDFGTIGDVAAPSTRGGAAPGAGASGERPPVPKRH